MKKKKSKIYFGRNTEKAIGEYLKTNEEDDVARHLIYVNKIQPAFIKLSENIINMPKFSFKKLNSNFSSLQDEVVTHLYTQLNKFNPRKLSKNDHKRVKAFSYFGTIAKNYLVQQCQKRDRTEFIYDNINNDDNKSIRLDETMTLVSKDDYHEQMEMKEFFDVLSKHFEQCRKKYCEDKRKIADAIIFFIQNVQKEEIWNRRYVFLLLKEYSGLSSKIISMYLKEFAEEYQEIRKKFYEEYI